MQKGRQHHAQVVLHHQHLQGNFAVHKHAGMLGVLRSIFHGLLHDLQPLLHAIQPILAGKPETGDKEKAISKVSFEKRPASKARFAYSPKCVPCKESLSWQHFSFSCFWFLSCKILY